MGQEPPATMSFGKVARVVPPLVHWSGAQHYLNDMCLGTRLATIDPEDHLPVGISHIVHWMAGCGRAMMEHKYQGPHPAAGTPEGEKWMRRNYNQAKGFSISGKGPAAAIGQPWVVCTSYHTRKCGGWTSLESLATSPFCAWHTLYHLAQDS
eukprot:12123608-Karenia_brevis.AAC.1